MNKKFAIFRIQKAVTTDFITPPTAAQSLFAWDLFFDTYEDAEQKIKELPYGLYYIQSCYYHTKDEN